MKNNVIKKAMAVVLAGSMVLGNGIMVFASSATGLTGEGGVEGLINKDVVSVEVPTSTEIAGRFDFILDPQNLIQKSIATNTAKDGYSAATFPSAKANTLYFANVASEGTTASDATAVSNNTELSISVTDPDVVAANYVYKSTDDKYWLTGSDAQTAFTAGWYTKTDADNADTATEDNKLSVAVTPVTPTGISITGTPASGNTITVTAKVAGTEATYTHSGTSDAITATNKGFTDVIVTINASMSDLGDKIKMTKDNTFANDTNPTIYLAVQGGETPTVSAIQTGKTETNGTYLLDSIAANAWADFNAVYANGAYSAVPAEGKSWKTYDFKLTGKANPNGAWTTDLATVTPSVNVVWNFEKKRSTNDITMTLAKTGVISVNNTTEAANIASMDLYDEAGMHLGFDTLASSMTWGTTGQDGEPTWTEKDGGDFTMSMSDTYLEYWDGVKVTAVLTLTDGTSLVSGPVAIEKPTN